MVALLDGRAIGCFTQLPRYWAFEPKATSGTWVALNSSNGHDHEKGASTLLLDGRVFWVGGGEEPEVTPFELTLPEIYYPALPSNVAGVGGGVCGGTLNNCTLAGNSARQGGGAAQAALHNCIVQFNSAADGPNYDASSTLAYCCTTPDTGGTGNITNAPLFVDTNSWADLRLQPGSPCIDAGNSDYVASATDLDGNPRIQNGIVDMGAYEFALLPPPTPAELVRCLIDNLIESDLRHKRPLLASLQAAQASIERRDHNSATGQLGAFQNKVRVQLTDPVLAMELTHAASEVIAALEPDDSPKMLGRIHSLKRHPNGRMHMQIKGQAGTAYILENSTNLVDWKPICVVRPGAEGNCYYEDLTAGKHPCRFYRVVPR